MGWSARRGAVLLALALGACTVAAGSDAPTPAEPEAAGLRPGMRVAVTVEGQAGLSGTFELDRDGEIDMPLIGGVDAYGLTPPQLEDRVVARLADGYLREPRVAVAKLQPRPFFILGDVPRPGSYSYEPGMTVADAIAAAGGDPQAGQVGVVVTPAGRERDARPAELATELEPGDIVTLEAPAG